MWALWDSGSGLTTCPCGFFPEGQKHAAKKLPKLVTATGDPVNVDHACTVDLEAETGGTLKISFQESNVDKVIISAAESLPPGSSAMIRKDGPSYIEISDGSRIPLHRSNGALWLKLSRTAQIEKPALTIAAAGPSAGPVVRTPPAEIDVEDTGGATSASSGVPRVVPEDPVAAEAAALEPDVDEIVKDAEELPDAAFLAFTEESQHARARGIPVMPAAADREVHRLTHWPFRAWCVWCVYGMGKEEAHRRAKVRRSDTPIVGLDYLSPRSARASCSPC